MFLLLRIEFEGILDHLPAFFRFLTSTPSTSTFRRRSIRIAPLDQSDLLVCGVEVGILSDQGGFLCGGELGGGEGGEDTGFGMGGGGG